MFGEVPYKFFEDNALPSDEVLSQIIQIEDYASFASLIKQEQVTEFQATKKYFKLHNQAENVDADNISNIKDESVEGMFK